jgi:hypothetical protein
MLRCESVGSEAQAFPRQPARDVVEKKAMHQRPMPGTGHTMPDAASQRMIRLASAMQMEPATVTSYRVP